MCAEIIKGYNPIHTLSYWYCETSASFDAKLTLVTGGVGSLPVFSDKQLSSECKFWKSGHFYFYIWDENSTIMDTKILSEISYYGTPICMFISVVGQAKQNSYAYGYQISHHRYIWKSNKRKSFEFSNQ